MPRIAALTSVVVCLAAAAQANDGVEFFEKRVRPVLVEHCYECHSGDAKKIGGELLLDSREGLLKGGETGPAIEPGKADASLLVRAVRYTDDGLQMPPSGKLPATTIADLEQWVAMGAPDPRVDAPAAKKPDGNWADILRSRRDWWSLKPVVEPALPSTNDTAWPRQPMDRFILAAIEGKGLLPGGRAPAATLARRLSLVLTGLPPTPAQVAELTAAQSEPAFAAAVERYVDSLLASPRFGERWARHWMDVVRFTETHGNEWNYEVHHAWRYRDYLIRAFNADLPYDQLIREHLAGDLLPPRWNEAGRFNEAIIATAFYRFGEVNHDDCISLPDIGYDLEDNQIDTLTKAFQATTVACARCHDHKLDAVSMRDYYALLGVLRSSRMVSHTIDAPDSNVQTMGQLRALKGEIRGELAVLWKNDGKQIAAYLQAARAKRANHPYAEQFAMGLDAARLEKWVAALAVEKAPLDDPLEPLRRLTAAGDDPAAFAAAWQKLVQEFTEQDRQRSEFNQSQLTTFADFRSGASADWHVGGHGLREGPARSGEFVLDDEGERLVKAVLPAGIYTHALSERLNGTLRSAVLPPGKKRISFQVVGERSSAVRLVSNNCQLNYVNYRALTSDAWQWITFSPPDDPASMRTYAELMTMFDNPKFPDQLSFLGGDKANYKLPWDKAAENPRSFFGVTHVVLHDGDPPKAELKHIMPLLSGSQPQNFNELTDRLSAVIERAIDNWAADRASDDDTAWLDALVRRELVTNHRMATPRLTELADRFRRIETALSQPTIVPGAADGGPGIEQPVFVRGDCRRPGETVERRYLEVLSGDALPFKSPASGRLELAERIASPTNPLTARVMVNRVWHHLFGTGIVQTVDDFGHIGELPSHPELLDYLAARFASDGWSLKRLIRSLVLSSTFQTATQPSATAQQIDPANRLLSHYPLRRLEAEAIRDGILATSGRLESEMLGMSVQPYRQDDNADRRLFAGPLDGRGRRSVYIKNNLMESPQFLGAFNVPGGKVAQGRRDVTNVPAQALAMLNDPFVLSQAKVWAARLVRQSDVGVGERIESMFQAALGRSAAEAEQARFAAAVRHFGHLHQVADADIMGSEAVWADVAHVVFNLAEFVYVH